MKKTLLSRLQSPTPKFFKVLRNVGLSIAATGAVLVSAPVSLPAILITIGGYLVVGGTVATGICQAVTKDEQ